MTWGRYPDVGLRVTAITKVLECEAQSRRGPELFAVELVLDATGVGHPIGDMLRERELSPRLVLFTGSDMVNQPP